MVLREAEAWQEAEVNAPVDNRRWQHNKEVPADKRKWHHRTDAGGANRVS